MNGGAVHNDVDDIDTDEEADEIVVRGMNPRYADLERAEIISAARAQLAQGKLTPGAARMLAALEDAHARLARLEK